ncbi:unnamed protein product [Blumeria hordei]|uniref:Uncharacterized protein n=1 Tax=Blumeria hordei TaxID=2867405 RepID=A0A383UQV4_BLUHO|nr:unnamed protein product [Blumeria hordei]
MSTPETKVIKSEVPECLSHEEDLKSKEMQSTETVIIKNEHDNNDASCNDVLSNLEETEKVKEESSEENQTVKKEHLEERVIDKKIGKETPPTYPDGVLKATARNIEGVSNSKYDPSILPTTDDPQKIRAQLLIVRQVEFYFGDANLPTDKFMWGLTEGSSNVPVSVKKICEFGRMRRFSPYEAIVSALKESKFLQVSGEEGAEVINRRIAFDPDTPRNKAESRSIYAKGFGNEEPSSQFDIEAFFAPYGPTNAVRLRRTHDKLFKGSVFVEFADEETAQKFLDLPNKPLWKGEHCLRVMSKKAYMDLKMEEIKSGTIEPASSDKWLQGRGRGRGRGNRGGQGQSGRHRDDRDPNDWKKRREDDRASGFKDDRNRNRGGRGRGRGRGENKCRNGRDRNSDRKQEGENSNQENKSNPNAISVNPNRQSEAQKSSESLAANSNDSDARSAPNQSVENQHDNSPSKKRGLEDDGGNEQGACKKVNIKTEASAGE